MRYTFQTRECLPQNHIHESQMQCDTDNNQHAHVIIEHTSLSWSCCNTNDKVVVTSSILSSYMMSSKHFNFGKRDENTIDGHKASLPFFDMVWRNLVIEAKIAESLKCILKTNYHHYHCSAIVNTRYLNVFKMHFKPPLQLDSGSTM